MKLFYLYAICYKDNPKVQCDFKSRVNSERVWVGMHSPELLLQLLLLFISFIVLFKFIYFIIDEKHNFK